MSLFAHEVESSYHDYLSVEEMSPIVRHEFIDGSIFAMAGGTIEHARLIANVLGVLFRALPPGGPCQVFPGELKIRIDACNVTTYPDVSVVCGDAERTPLDPHGYVNPTLIVEITSKSTEKYDRGAKLGYYMALESVREVLIVSHRERRLTVHRRLPRRRELAVIEWTSRQPLLLESVSVSLTLDEIYRGVELPK